MIMRVKCVVVGIIVVVRLVWARLSGMSLIPFAPHSPLRFRVRQDTHRSRKPPYQAKQIRSRWCLEAQIGRLNQINSFAGRPVSCCDGQGRGWWAVGLDWIFWFERRVVAVVNGSGRKAIVQADELLTKRDKGLSGRLQATVRTATGGWTNMRKVVRESQGNVVDIKKTASIESAREEWTGERLKERLTV